MSKDKSILPSAASRCQQTSTALLYLTHHGRSLLWTPEGVLVLVLVKTQFRPWLFTSTITVVMKEGIVFKALGVTAIDVADIGVIFLGGGELCLLHLEWMILMRKEIWVTILIIFKGCPSGWVATLLSGSISHTLHLSHVILEFLFHHIQHHISIPITPWPWWSSQNKGRLVNTYFSCLFTVIEVLLTHFNVQTLALSEGTIYTRRKKMVALLGKELFQVCFVNRKLGGNCFNLIIPDESNDKR